MTKTGKCLCGAVQLKIEGAPQESGACHCEMCRRWTGGVFVSVTVPADGIAVTGGEAIKIFASSSWAERAFCATCGSNLWYRVTAPGPHQGEYYVGLGVFDEPDGMPLKTELFIDRKPDGYSFDADTEQLTAEQVMAMFAES